MLVALQQSPQSLSNQVFDQFLRRRLNQVYFGFFLGLAIYSLVTMSTVGGPFRPVFGAAVAVVLTMVALVLLLALLYTAVNQMRPARSSSRFTTTRWRRESARSLRSSARGHAPSATGPSSRPSTATAPASS